MAPWNHTVAVQNTLNYSNTTAKVNDAGPNGTSPTTQIVWDTPTLVPQATLPTSTTVTVMAPSLFVKRASADDLWDFGLLEDGEMGFDPSDPNVEIVETLHNEDGSMIVAEPKPTKVAGAFGPGGGPALGTDFIRHHKPVAPNSRHRQKNKSEMKKAQKKKGKKKQNALQEERKAYLAGLAAKKAAAQAAAEAEARQ